MAFFRWDWLTLWLLDDVLGYSMFKTQKGMIVSSLVG